MRDEGGRVESAPHTASSFLGLITIDHVLVEAGYALLCGRTKSSTCSAMLWSLPSEPVPAAEVRVGRAHHFHVFQFVTTDTLASVRQIWRAVAAAAADAPDLHSSTRATSNPSSSTTSRQASSVSHRGAVPLLKPLDESASEDVDMIDKNDVEVVYVEE